MEFSKVQAMRPVWLLTLLLFLMLYGEVVSDSISGTITEDVKFFYRKLSSIPSKFATLEYSVSYRNASFCSRTDRYCRVILSFYTTNHNNGSNRACADKFFHQILNKHLVVTLPPFLHTNQKQMDFASGEFRNHSHCKVDLRQRSIHCTSKIFVQEYKPTDFAFSLSFSCSQGFKLQASLKGLQFNMTIEDQSNVTECDAIVEENIRRNCGFGYTSLPNLIGMTSLKEVEKLVQQLQLGRAMINKLGDSGVLFDCYQHLDELLCYLFFPKCDEDTKQVTHVCREMCLDFVEACYKNAVALYEKLKLEDILPFRGNLPLDMTRMEDAKITCRNLPSKEDKSTPCFFKSVQCGPPPRVPNAKIENSTSKLVFSYNSTFVYSCVGEGFVARNSKRITCLFSGNWSKPPTCLAPTENPVPVAVVILLFPSAIFFMGVCLCQVLLAKGPRRKREYDAFVCYQFDASHGYVFNTLKPKLEPQFKLFIHSIDFEPGSQIIDNITNAIRKSNTAIIILSQEFLKVIGAGKSLSIVVWKIKMIQLSKFC